MGNVSQYLQGSTLRHAVRRERGRYFLRTRWSLATSLVMAVLALANVQGTAPAGATSTPLTASFTQQGCTTWSVPVGVTSVTIDAVGAAGGSSGAAGGDGDGESAVVSTPTPTTFDICVDEGGGAASSGGGTGGGASGVSVGTTFAEPIVVGAGGGGSGGGDTCVGTCGVGAGGNAGAAGVTVVDRFATGSGVGGGGASEGSVGAGGAGGGNLGYAGTGGAPYTAAGPGSGGVGGSSGDGGGGGGGGGGFNGGGGGGATGNGFGGAGGGGGADFCGNDVVATPVVSDCATAVAAGTGTSAQGGTGDPEVTITYDAPTPVLNLSDPVGTPVAGTNTYDVALTLPQGGAAPSQAVVVTDGVQSCDATLTLAYVNGSTWTGNCSLSAELANATVSASYPGDSNYAGANATTTLVVAQATPSISIVVSGSTTPGQSITAAGDLAGGDGPSGTIAFHAYASSSCNGAVAFSSSGAVNGDGSYSAVGLSALTTGTYYLDAVYSGDANNATVTSVCSSAYHVTAATVAPTITSASTAYFIWLGPTTTFHVVVSGTPTATLSESGTLPQGLKFSASTDTISGSAGLLALGSHTVTLTATNGTNPPAVEKLVIVVGFAPLLLTPSTTTFTEGRMNALLVVSLGSPTATLSESGALPPGVGFTAFNDGTGEFSGSPQTQSASTYVVTVSAINGFQTTVQTLVLRVSPAPTHR